MKVFTTGQVAKICKVAPRTVGKWFDSGRLVGFRIPGSQDRRIPRECLIRFLKEHGMPLGDLADATVAKVLLVTHDSILLRELERELPQKMNFKFEAVGTIFDAGIETQGFNPDCVIIDFCIGPKEAARLCQNLRRNANCTDMIIIVLLPDNVSMLSFDRSTINETFKKPFDAALLAERLRTLIGARKKLV